MPSSVVTGFESAVFTTVTCQPEPASGFNRVIGWSSGNWTRNPVTAAVADSLGTRKVRMTSLVPCGMLDGLTVTWAPATAASRTTNASAHAAASPSFLIICDPPPPSRRPYCTVSTKLTSGWLNAETCTCNTICHVPTMGGFGLLRSTKRPTPTFFMSCSIGPTFWDGSTR